MSTAKISYIITYNQAKKLIAEYPDKLRYAKVYVNMGGKWGPASGFYAVVVDDGYPERAYVFTVDCDEDQAEIEFALAEQTGE